MAFFRKWKTHYKHKKFTSDDAVDAEDWGLEKPRITSTDMPTTDNMKLDFDCIDVAEDAASNDNDDDDDNTKALCATYDIKYLGCTPIETKRSEKITSEAIKTVISNSKAGGRKIKSQKRVILNVSPDGIEVLDHQSKECLMQYSIYKISYCSVDAAHDHAFTFVSSEIDPLSEQEKMSCHVFHCSKRKIAHEITLMVARCFENAYQHWRDAVVQHAKSQGISINDPSIDPKKVLKEQNGIIAAAESRAEVHQHQQKQQQQQQQQQQQNSNGIINEQKSDALLIDLAASDNMLNYLQNTWVSFEDDARDGIAAY